VFVRLAHHSARLRMMSETKHEKLRFLIPKREAALAMGVSVRTLENYIRRKELAVRKRPVVLSITHNFRSDRETQLDIRQARQASPYHTISRRRIPGTRQVSAQLSELEEVSGK
jgi:hypothetical protein